jgi:NitT/TauT family transport system ATP-binding protein/sulfonate transport system ATP-binding protein
MTPRPGKISEVIEVKLEHPRDKGSQSFVELRNKILEQFHLASSSESPEYII